MTPKRRVYTALSGGQPDRVPIFPVITYMHASRLARLPVSHYQMHPMDGYDALLRAWEAYELDGFELPLSPSREHRAAIGEERGADGWFLTHAGMRVARLLEDDQPVPLNCEPPVRSLADLEKMRVTTAEEYEEMGCLDGVKRVVAAVGEGAFLAGHAAGQTMNSLVAWLGSQRALLALYDEPELVRAVMARATDGCMQVARAMIGAGVDGIYMGDAWSSCSVISPAVFREFCAPEYARFVAYVHALGKPVYMHICGNSAPILEDIADTGVDAIEPLDPLGGVRLDDAKRRVGARVCLKGGINTLSLLYGDRASIFAEVRAAIEAAAPGGGYLFGTGDDIPRDAPIENLIAMRDAVHEYGQYAR